MRKAPATNDVVEDLERSNVNSPVGASSSFIIFVNFAAPVLTLPIRSVSVWMKESSEDGHNFGRKRLRGRKATLWLFCGEMGSAVAREK
jgi:hypothetical protein